MATKVTEEIIIQINELYIESKNYSAVGRELGLSPSTIKKYVKIDYVKKFNIIPQLLTCVELNSIERFVCPISTLTDENALLLSKYEKEDIEYLWEMLSIW